MIRSISGPRGALVYLDRVEHRERERKEDLARWERFVLTGEAVDHGQVRDWLVRLSRGERHPWR